MKKLLLFGTLLMGSFISAQAQTLLTENFNGLTVGNVSTDITGAVAGQGGFSFFSSNGTATTSTNAGAANAKIIDAGGNLVLQMTGPNGSGGSNVLFKAIDPNWAGRTAGNDIMELEFDINPGDGTTTSRNVFGIYIYDTTGTKVLVGAVVRPATRVLQLVAYSQPTGQPAPNNFTYNVAATPGLVLPANQTSRIGIAFDKTTGAAYIKGPGIAAAGVGTMGAAAGSDVGEIDIIAISGHVAATPNTSSTTATFDNVVARASATDTLLGLENTPAVASSFSIYPNPATNVINITNADGALVNGVEILDINGRTVKSVKFSGVAEAQVNVAELSAGIYLMNVASDKGTITKKIVKQ